LFYSLGASKETQEELDQTLYHFLNIKNKRKQNSREALIYPIVKDVISKNGLKFDPVVIWEEVIDSFDGEIDTNNKNMFHTADYGDFYRSTVIGMITDKFGGELDHKRKGNLIEFNKDIFESMGKQYDDITGIQTKEIDGICDSCDPRDSRPDMPASNSLGEAFRKFSYSNSSLEFQDNKSVNQYESPESPESPKKKCPYCDYEEQPFFLKVHVMNSHREGKNVT
jgi:hypothetical protein